MTIQAGRRFPRVFAGLLLLHLLLGGPLAAEQATDTNSLEAKSSEAVEWTERTVDLYVDTQLRHDASVLRSQDGDAWAILIPGSDDALVLGVEGEVRRAPAAGFSWTEPLVATSATLPEAKAVGTWTEIDGGWVAKTPDVALLALPHQGPAGPIDTDELWRTVPSWQRLQEAWRPDMDDEQGETEAMEVLKNLAAADTGVHFEAIFGTWCGDSRRSVPKLLAAADELGLDVSLVAMRRGFEEPLHYARDQRVTNVPTILVKRGEIEIGRFVERPRSASVITDLAAILQRRPVPPPDAFSDGDVLLARGEYLLRSADGAEIGRETWSLFRTDEGNTRLGSRQVDTAGAVTEVWQRWTPAAEGGRTGFVEVTRDARGERSRTRLSRRGGEDRNDAIHALTRGDAGGIVEQDVAVPANAVVISPGVAASGLAWQAAGRPESSKLTAVALPGAGEGFAARQDEAELMHVARVELYDPSLGDVPVDHVVLRRGGARPATQEWWLHTELGVPVRAAWEGGGSKLSAELVWLEIAARP